MRRRMNTAFERRLVQPDRRKHGRDARDMCRLAAVRSLRKRQLSCVKPESVGGAGFHHRQRLDGLHRRTWKHGLIDVAEPENLLAARIHHDESAAMAALHLFTARDFDENGIVHCRPLAALYGRFIGTRRNSRAAAENASPAGHAGDWVRLAWLEVERKNPLDFAL